MKAKQNINFSVSCFQLEILGVNTCMPVIYSHCEPGCQKNNPINLWQRTGRHHQTVSYRINTLTHTHREIVKEMRHGSHPSTVMDNINRLAQMLAGQESLINFGNSLVNTLYQLKNRTDWQEAPNSYECMYGRGASGLFKDYSSECLFLFFIKVPIRVIGNSAEVCFIAEWLVISSLLYTYNAIALCSVTTS